MSDGRPITAVRWWGSNIPKSVPTDPKLCPVEGAICDNPALQCICTLRIDGTLNCADPDTLGDPCPAGLQCADDADCTAPAKCFLAGAALGCCGYNCGEGPVDPKACEGKGTVCGDPNDDCICETRPDGTTQCADATDYLFCGHGLCQVDADCMDPDTKCFVQPGADGCCAHNCGEHPVDPKVCTGKGTSCGDPLQECVCETRFDGTLNCADAGDFFGREVGPDVVPHLA